MNEVVDHARAALQAYLDRGNRVLSALKNERSMLASRRLSWRNGAFVRFCRLDAEALRLDLNLAADQEILKIWQQIKEQDLLIQRGLEDKKDEVQRALAQGQMVRQVIGKFRSHSAKQSAFHSTI